MLGSSARPTSFGVGSAVYARTSCVSAHEALVDSVLLAPLSTYVASKPLSSLTERLRELRPFLTPTPLFAFFRFQPRQRSPNRGFAPNIWRQTFAEHEGDEVAKKMGTACARREGLLGNKH